jgi:hypothetical protein
MALQIKLIDVDKISDEDMEVTITMTGSRDPRRGPPPVLSPTLAH